MKKTLAVSLGVLVFGVVFLFRASSVYAEAYGWSPDVNKSTTETPGVCSGAKPAAPILYQPNHPILPQPTGRDQIRLQWTKVSNASGYVVNYGLTSKNYIYSVQLPDSSTSYTIGHLGNRMYYFTVQAKSGCAVGFSSNEWGARPNGGAIMTRTAVVTPVRRTIAPTTPAPAAPVLQRDEVRPVTPPVAPVAPVTPKAVVPPSNPGLFESIMNFFGGLFK